MVISLLYNDPAACKINNSTQVSNPTRPIHFEWPFASAYIMQPPTSTSSPVNPRTPPAGVNLLKQVYTSMNCAIASGVVVNAAITVAVDPVTTTARSAVHFVFMRCGLPVRLVVHSKLSSYVLVHGGRHTVGVKKRRAGSCCAWWVRHSARAVERFGVLRTSHPVRWGQRTARPACHPISSTAAGWG